MTTDTETLEDLLGDLDECEKASADIGDAVSSATCAEKIEDLLACLVEAEDEAREAIKLIKALRARVAKAMA